MMFCLGVLGMAVLCCIRAKRYRLSYAKAVCFSLLLAVCGLLGTKILYVLENWEYTMENGLTLGGTSFFGALFFVPLAVSAFGLLFRLGPKESMDFCAPPVIMILMFMRLGCLMNGCCGGILLGNFQVPTQMIEAIGDACIFVYLLYREATDKKHGLLYPFLMSSYGCMRFLIEFLRDTPKDWLYLSHGQWFSVIAIAVACFWMFGEKRRNVLYEK